MLAGSTHLLGWPSDWWLEKILLERQLTLECPIFGEHIPPTLNSIKKHTINQKQMKCSQKEESPVRGSDFSGPMPNSTGGVPYSRTLRKGLAFWSILGNHAPPPNTKPPHIQKSHWVKTPAHLAAEMNLRDRDFGGLVEALPRHLTGPGRGGGQR